MQAFYITGPIVHVSRCCHLTTGLKTCDDDRIQIRSGRVHGGGAPSRSRAGRSVSLLALLSRCRLRDAGSGAGLCRPCSVWRCARRAARSETAPSPRRSTRSERPSPPRAPCGGPIVATRLLIALLVRACSVQHGIHRCGGRRGAHLGGHVRGRLLRRPQLPVLPVERCALIYFRSAAD